MTHKIQKEDKPVYLAIVREKPVVGEVMKNFMRWQRKDFGLKCCRATSKVTKVEDIEEYTYKVTTADGTIYIVQTM